MTTDNIHLIAADLARRIPEMAKDSPINNATVIENLLREQIRQERYVYTAADAGKKIAEAEAAKTVICGRCGVGVHPGYATHHGGMMLCPTCLVWIVWITKDPRTTPPV